MSKKKYNYNHQWPEHRRWLAERLYKVAVGFGYILDFDNEFPEEIFIKRFPNGRLVKIFTSIDSRDGMARTHGMGCYFIKRINRAGTIDSIAGRLVRTIKEAEMKARYAPSKKNKKKT
jgi:hypothetical protein